MKLRLTPDVLAQAYEYLRVTNPFVSWNLPDADEIRFKVSRSRDLAGRYTYHATGAHTIEVSSGRHATTHALMMTMAHEMVHLHMRLTGMDNGSEHSAAFHKLKRAVCMCHGFDPQMF